MRVENAMQIAWPDVPAIVTHDLEIALEAAERIPGASGEVLVLSGTGSCCYGRSGHSTSKVGGWGHLLGDVASGYAIAHEALRKVVFEFDRHDSWTPLGQKFLEALMLNSPNDLIGWIQNASKAEIASLTKCVFATSGDRIAREVIDRTAHSLASDAVICGRRLAAKNKKIAFVLAGGVLLKQPGFARKLALLIQKKWPSAHVAPLRREGAWGAANMALKAVNQTHAGRSRTKASVERDIYVPDFNPSSSPTEQRNPASMGFHELPIQEMVELRLDAEHGVVPALRKERRAITKAAELATATLKRGGRIFYVGAGTSGRLGVLDASECPPTFRASPEMIQGVIAGGHRALWQAVEGAEDDARAGSDAMRFRRLTKRDLVIGIAASGRTPFVWGALDFARRSRVTTVLICFNPSLKIAPSHRPDLVIAPNLGPEILTGSTRLKSGTATKLILNTISTISMVRLGKVISNLMVDLNPSNVKLRNRAIRILQDLTACPPDRAEAALEKNGWIVKDAWNEIRKAPES